MTKAILAAGVFLLYASGKPPAGTGKSDEPKRDGCQSAYGEESPDESSSPSPGGAADWGAACVTTSDCLQSGQVPLECIAEECTWRCDTWATQALCTSRGGTCEGFHCYKH